LVGRVNIKFPRKFTCNYILYILITDSLHFVRMPPVHNIRQLQLQDFHKGFKDLLDQGFTKNIEDPKDPKKKFAQFYAAACNDSGDNGLYGNFVYVIELDNRIVASLKMVIELKCHNNYGKVAHIEDVVVHSEHRGKGLGKLLVNFALEISKVKECYKAVLCCNREYESYYKSLGFRQKGIEMCVYFNRGTGESSISKTLRTSYNKSALDYSDVLKTIISTLPSLDHIVEFGILDGFSLQCFAENCPPTTSIFGYDIFEDFNGNGANYDDMTKKFEPYSNVHIHRGDFYDTKGWESHNRPIDLLHVDIANDGDVYKFTIDNYLDLVKVGGVIIFEGGSEERDNVGWMQKYNKTKIKPYIDHLIESREDIRVTTLDKFPSVTIVKRLK